MTALPPPMKALRIHEFATPPRVTLDDVPPPQPAPGQVLIDVHASAISFVDLLRAEGKYQVLDTIPWIGGSECAGTVAAVGEGVTSHQVGDKVACLVRSCWAGQAVVDQDLAYRLSPDADLVAASALPAAYCTALYALRERGQLKAGETVLVLGAAGSVGYAAVEIAHLLGARVIAGARTADRRQAALEAGADEVVDTSTDAWKDEVKALAGKRGVDVIVDPVGGAATDTAFRTLGWGGRLLMVGFASGDIGKLGTNLSIVKGASLVGVDMRQCRERQPALAAQLMAEVMQWFGEGKLKPRIARQLPMADIQQAVADVQHNALAGRVVITMG
ncbi:NADPH:quinone oxidoreductase family protein [Comamonas serinivorans]|uniref:NADPH:quinone oxidoreductase family protein n=1 Tax=Comamonas serinivorans TaxID=1082851 RepID=UPI00146B1E22|nr:NADPH:quinone oxidoreductase family protein [Comamonas serinivorans]